MIVNSKVVGYNRYMKSILLITINESAMLTAVKHACAPFPVHVITSDLIHDGIEEGFECVIMLGDIAEDVMSPKYERYKEIIKNCKKPLLSIQLGCELFALSYHATVLQNDTSLEQEQKLFFYDQDIFSVNTPTYNALTKSHTVIKDPGDELTVLSSAQDTLSAHIIKHSYKPYYGLHMLIEDSHVETLHFVQSFVYAAYEGILKVPQNIITKQTYKRLLLKKKHFLS